MMPVSHNLLLDSSSTEMYTDVLGAWKYLHYWTVSRSLWDAPSSFDFFVLWKEKPHHFMANFEVGTLFETARGEDVDEFSKLMIVMYVHHGHCLSENSLMSLVLLD